MLSRLSRLSNKMYLRNRPRRDFFPVCMFALWLFQLAQPVRPCRIKENYHRVLNYSRTIAVTDWKLLKAAGERGGGEDEWKHDGTMESQLWKHEIQPGDGESPFYRLNNKYVSVPMRIGSELFPLFLKLSLNKCENFRDRESFIAEGFFFFFC